jgi:type IV pilus assembly protein PilE
LKVNYLKKDNTVKRSCGFTTIELLVVVVIIGILAAIVYPNYIEQTTKTRRSDGKAKLMEVMQAQERHYTVNQTYVTDLTELGYTSPLESDEGYYTISAAACGSGISSCVSLTAAPQNGQESDGDLTLDSVGNKTPADKW